MTIRKIALATALVALSAVATVPVAFAQSQAKDQSSQIQDGNNNPATDGNGQMIVRDPALKN